MTQDEKISIQVGPAAIKQLTILVSEAENFTNFVLQRLSTANNKREIVISYTPEDLLQLALTIHQLAQIAKNADKN